MKREFGGKVLEIVEGDITQQRDMDAVVNAANAQLAPGSGVAGAIHRAAGPGLYEECEILAPISCGEAVITGAHNLPNTYVIHCLGPVYGQDKPEDAFLARCYKNALQLAEDKALLSVAFPAISTGVFGYPLDEAAEVSLKTVQDTLPTLTSVRHVRFVLFGSEAYAAYADKLE